MIIDRRSNTNSSKTEKTIAQTLNVKIIKCIFHWQTEPAVHHPQLGTNCHCLLRIYEFEAENRAVIIASSLWSNRGNREIWSDLNSFVRAIVARFPHLKALLTNSTWITHSGQFSYPLSWSETFHRDCFDTVSVALNSQNEIEVDEESETEIEANRVKEFLNQMAIESVTEVLKQLKHDNGWGGVVDDRQIKACWELENGIVLDSVRETGSVGW